MSRIDFRALNNNLNYQKAAIWELIWAKQMNEDDGKSYIKMLDRIEEEVNDKIINRYGNIVAVHDDMKPVTESEFYKLK